MSVKFNIVQRGNPGDPSAPKKFYPGSISSGKTNLRQISNRIAQMNTVNRSIVQTVLDCLVQVMQDDLAEGRIVELGEFGSFTINVGGTGEMKKEDVTASNVTSAWIRFRPGSDLRNTLSTISFEKSV